MSILPSARRDSGRIAAIAALLLPALAALAMAAQPAMAEAAARFALHASPQVVPVIRFEDAGGNQMTLGDLHGKTLLVNIWATWCVPCRKEMPTLDRLQAELGGPEFEVVALSIDRKGAYAVRAFFDEIGIRNLELRVNGSGEVLSSLGLRGIPTTLLIDPEGHELGRLIGPAEWDSPEMIAFLKKLIPKEHERN